MSGELYLLPVEDGMPDTDLPALFLDVGDTTEVDALLAILGLVIPGAPRAVVRGGRVATVRLSAIETRLQLAVARLTMAATVGALHFTPAGARMRLYVNGPAYTLDPEDP